MAKEIEYKFIIDKEKFLNEEKQKVKVLHSRQGYFTVKEDSVSSFRIALLEHFYPNEWTDAILNIKGKRIGATRTEIETELPYEEGEQLFNMTTDRIEKTRYKVPAKVKNFNNCKWEVDIYEGKNFPLAVAELELPAEDIEFEKPDWVLQDVTSEDKFYNANLAKYPFSEWK